jgi:hypothetical protein
LIWYSRACGSYQYFLYRGLLLTRQLLNQGFSWLSWSHHFERFTVATMTCYGISVCVTNTHGYVPLVVNTSRFLPHSWFITGFETRLTRQVPLVEKELPTLPQHLSSPPVFSGVPVTRSLVLCVCFVDRCLSFCPFSFDHCVVCPSIDWFWLPLWYLQNLLDFANKTVIYPNKCAL